MAGITQQDVTIRIEHIELSGMLAVFPEAQGIVVFAHGSGSSRFSPRNQEVAEALRHAALRPAQRGGGDDR